MSTEVIDLTMLESYAEAHASVYEVAALFAIPATLLKTMLGQEFHDTRYRMAWVRGRAKGNIKLRQLQWKHATSAGSGGVAMTRHLSEHWLGEGSDVEIQDSTAPDGAKKRNNAITVNVALIPNAQQQTIESDQNGAVIESASREGFELEDFANHET